MSEIAIYRHLRRIEQPNNRGVQTNQEDSDSKCRNLHTVVSSGAGSQPKSMGR